MRVCGQSVYCCLATKAGLTLEEYQHADAQTLQVARERAQAKLQQAKPHI